MVLGIYLLFGIEDVDDSIKIFFKGSILI